jgi:uncharacterized protein
MVIDLAALSPGVQVLAADEEVAFEDVDGSENRISCHIELDVRNTDEAVYIHAVVSGVLTTPCHKCLEPAEYRVEPAFDIVVKRISGASSSRPPAQDDDLLYVHPDDREVSLDAQVYENLIASIPIRILCKEDCKGLCPGCGANLNLDACRCAKKEDQVRGTPPASEGAERI